MHKCCSTEWKVLIKNDVLCRSISVSGSKYENACVKIYNLNELTL